MAFKSVLVYNCQRKHQTRRLMFTPPYAGESHRMRSLLVVAILAALAACLQAQTVGVYLERKCLECNTYSQVSRIQYETAGYTHKFQKYNMRPQAIVKHLQVVRLSSADTEHGPCRTSARDSRVLTDVLAACWVAHPADNLSLHIPNNRGRHLLHHLHQDWRLCESLGEHLLI